MTRQPDLSEMDEYYERTRRPLVRIPDNRIGRMGCGCLLMAWFIALLLPCAMIWLAFGNSITLQHGDIPEPDQHPRFQIQLIMESDNRGLKITSSHITSTQADDLCIQNQVDYWLWQSDSSAAPATYCQCYERADDQAAWQFTRQIEGTCP